MLDRIPEVQGGMVVLDNKTGAIRAMVGGFDFELSKFNRATQALRQPGSVFKPFTYLVALEEERSPYERVLDAPVSYLDAVGNLYEPKNSDENFKGLIPMYQALAESRNVPTIRLARALGVEKIIAAVKRFGINHDFLPVLSVALGSVETTLLEMVSAFSAFPNSGVRAEPHYLVRVEDYEGVTLEERRMRFEQATSPDIAAKMVYLLRQVVLRGTARRANVLGRPVAGKTGTTNESTDVWFVGFTPDINCGSLGRPRPENLAGREGLRRQPGSADLDRVHGGRAQGGSARGLREHLSSHATRNLTGGAAGRPACRVPPDPGRRDPPTSPSRGRRGGRRGGRKEREDRTQEPAEPAPAPAAQAAGRELKRCVGKVGDISGLRPEI